MERAIISQSGCKWLEVPSRRPQRCRLGSLDLQDLPEGMGIAESDVWKKDRSIFWLTNFHNLHYCLPHEPLQAIKLLIQNCHLLVILQVLSSDDTASFLQVVQKIFSQGSVVELIATMLRDPIEGAAESFAWLQNRAWLVELAG